jgi:hypothetical protein
MTNDMEMKQIAVEEMTEGAINGLSHLMTIKDWETLLEKRLSAKNSVQPLSAEFILEHRNDMCLTLFPVFALLMRNEGLKGYDLNFLHKFWAFFNWEGGEGAECQVVKKIITDKAKFDSLNADLFGSVSNWLTYTLLEKENLQDVVAILPKLSDIEKNPYGYCNAQLNAVLEFSPEVPMEFLERFVHLVKFPSILCNLNVKPEVIADVFNKFGVKIGRTQKYLFPDGTVAKKSNPFDNMLPAKNYLDNIQRYATEDEKAIKEVVAKFPRVLQLCDEGDNALAMKGN